MIGLAAALVLPAASAAAQTMTLPAQPAPQGQPQPAKPRMTPEKLRPASSQLIDCRQAPPQAVTALTEPLSRWFTVYCTRRGHLFASNDRYFSAFPGTSKRGAINAAELSGRSGDLGHKAYFTKITYTELPPAETTKVVASASPEAVPVVKDKPLSRIDLTVDTGQTYSLVVAAPQSDPFWVIPLVDGKLARTGFYMATLDYVNRSR
jgi:hypothetical protein